MFYEGSLQEAIQSAVQQSKLVVCFVTGESTIAQFVLWASPSSLTDQLENEQTKSLVALDGKLNI